MPGPRCWLCPFPCLSFPTLGVQLPLEGSQPCAGLAAAPRRGHRSWRSRSSWAEAIGPWWGAGEAAEHCNARRVRAGDAI